MEYCNIFIAEYQYNQYNNNIIVPSAGDIPMCHSSMAILRTFHNSPKRQRFFELVLDVYISEPHVKKNKRPL